MQGTSSWHAEHYNNNNSNWSELTLPKTVHVTCISLVTGVGKSFRVVSTYTVHFHGTHQHDISLRAYWNTWLNKLLTLFDYTSIDNRWGHCRLTQNEFVHSKRIIKDSWCSETWTEAISSISEHWLLQVCSCSISSAILSWKKSSLIIHVHVSMQGKKGCHKLKTTTDSVQLVYHTNLHLSHNNLWGIKKSTHHHFSIGLFIP